MAKGPWIACARYEPCEPVPFGPVSPVGKGVRSNHTALVATFPRFARESLVRHAIFAPRTHLNSKLNYCALLFALFPFRLLRPGRGLRSLAPSRFSIAQVIKQFATIATLNSGNSSTATQRGKNGFFGSEKDGRWR